MLIIIPARLASTRLANKVLLDFAGVPMCVKTAQIAQDVAPVIIAADDESICQAASAHGIKSVLTSKNHQSGSERLAQAAQILGLADDEIVINLQADEPLFGQENLKAFCKFAQERAGEYFMASAYYLDSEPGNSDRVKVVCDNANYAMYFSRSALPFYRSTQEPNYRHHIGIYAYSAASLQEFITLPSRLEDIEKLEQLRALENGKKILMCELANNGSFGIDSEDDYERALKILQGNER